MICLSVKLCPQRQKHEYIWNWVLNLLETCSFTKKVMLFDTFGLTPHWVHVVTLLRAFHYVRQTSRIVLGRNRNQLLTGKCVVLFDTFGLTPHWVHVVTLLRAFDYVRQTSRIVLGLNRNQLLTGRCYDCTRRKWSINIYKNCSEIMSPLSLIFLSCVGHVRRMCVFTALQRYLIVLTDFSGVRNFPDKSYVTLSMLFTI